MAHSTPSFRYRGSADPPVSVGVWVARFTVTGLLVTVALAAASGVLARRAGTDEARRSAAELAGVTASALSPLLDTNPAADPAAGPGPATTVRRQLAAVVTAGPAVRVDVARPSGRVLWSSDPLAEGRTFPVESAGTTPATGPAGVTVVGPSPAGNGFPRRSGDLLAAVVGVRDVHGAPLLVATYTPAAVATAAARTAWLRFVPSALGALILLLTTQVLLGWRLARRLRRSREAEELLRHAAADAADAERRRIAGDVHDHVVQDLTGLAYDLDAARLQGGLRSAEDERLLARTARRVRVAVSDLRMLLVSLVPSRLPDGDLGASLEALAAGLRSSGITVVVQAGGADRLPVPVASLLYRCAQEALRNVEAHSRATTVELTVQCDEGDVMMIIDDDGCGFDQERLAESRSAGHLGLRALGDVLADAGGSLVANSAPGQGTRLAVTLPLAAGAVRTQAVR